MSEVNATTCKKCGEQHRIDHYKNMHFYFCPAVNRVLLVNDSDELVRESRVREPDVYGEF